jgi:DNA-binding response OmpR family regulator
MERPGVLFQKPVKVWTAHLFLSNFQRMSRATIFLIEEDDETRRLLVASLKGQGYRVLLAVDEEDAMERAGGGRLEADLVLVNLVGKAPEEAIVSGRRIRGHAELSAGTPLVVLAEKYGPDLEGTDVQVGENEWITYPENGEQLERLLARLTAGLDPDS